jgi:hypothetical protein
VKAKDAEIPGVLARVCAETPPHRGSIYEEGPIVSRCVDAVDVRAAPASRIGAVADLVGSVIATLPRLRAPEQQPIEVGLRLLRTPDIREDQPTMSQRLQHGLTTDHDRSCVAPDGGVLP